MATRIEIIGSHLAKVYHSGGDEAMANEAHRLLSQQGYGDPESQHILRQVVEDLWTDGPLKQAIIERENGGDGRAKLGGGGSGLSQEIAQNLDGHNFEGHRCGVCRECGMCTFRLIGDRPCFFDSERSPSDCPQFCECGAGIPVCSICGVGPCCSSTPCTSHQDGAATMEDDSEELEAAIRLSNHLACQSKMRSTSVQEIDLDYVLRCTENWAPHRLLGEGGYGKVYRGTDAEGGEILEFAAKCLECESEEDREMLNQATEAEIKTLSSFTHQNIIKLLGFCKTKDTAVLLYAYEPAGSVERHLRTDNLAEQLSWSVRAKIVKGLLAAVHHLHKFDPQGPCYHRDVKPGNVVLTAQMDPKLIDCGLARLVTPDSCGRRTMSFRASTNSGALGTPGFKCPKYERTGVFDEKSEIFSVGITILQIVTGLLDFADNRLDGLVESPDASNIKQTQDARPPGDGLDSIIQGLSTMAEKPGKIAMDLFTLPRYSSYKRIQQMQSRKSIVPKPHQRCDLETLKTMAMGLRSEAEEIDLDYVLRCTENWAPHRLLGEGGYGKVYRGTDNKDGEIVEFAAKRLECQCEEDRDILNKMTEAEIRTLSSFTHQNIIKLLGFCKTKDTTVLLYEYGNLGSVEMHLQQDELAQQLSWVSRTKIVTGVIAAIHHLHSHDPRGPCYHRDVKPGNIVLLGADGDFTPKLIDCGLARLVIQGTRKTCRSTGFAAPGTPGFCDPKYSRTGAFNAKSEIYAIGITILQIVTGLIDFKDSKLDDLVAIPPCATSIFETRDARPSFESEDEQIIYALSKMVAHGIGKYDSRDLKTLGAMAGMEL